MIEIREALDPAALADCLAIRRAVFIEEQGVSEAEEMDGLDAQCRHFLAVERGRSVGAARVKPLDGPDWPDGGWKVQRVAVRAEARGRGVGRALMAHIAAMFSDGRPVALDSQVSALGFYERLGFCAEGPEFLDAGIPHRRMRLRAGV